MSAGAGLLNDDVLCALFRLTGDEARCASLGDSATAFSRLLAQTSYPGTLLITLRLMLQGGLLPGAMQQVQALYLLHAASPDSCQPLLVSAAAEEAAPAAVRVLAFRLLADDGNGKQLRSLTARQFVQQINVAELEGAPTLAELKQQFAGSGVEGPQACWAAEAGAAAMPTLPPAQLVAVGLLQSWEGNPILDAETRQRVAMLRTALLLWFGAQQVQRVSLLRPVEGQQQGLERHDGGQQQGQQDHQSQQELASHPLSLPASPQLTMGPAAEPSKPAAPTQQQQQQQAGASRGSGALVHQPNGDCASLLLLQEALRQPLVPSEQQRLLRALLAAGTASPLLQALWTTSRQAFADLVQHNPLVAAEAVVAAMRLGQQRAAERFLAAVAEAPLGPQSMECMSVVAAAGLAPDDALRAFAVRCIGAADTCAEPGRQGRLVRLLCAFVGLLLRHAPSAVLGMQEELAAFCIQHSRHVPAAELYRRLMALASADRGSGGC